MDRKKGEGFSMSLPSHNTQSTIHFLKQLKKDIWVLTAIHPKSSKITTASFRPKNEEAAFKWIEKRQGKFNLYFMVNEPLRELKTKAKKADVKEVTYLHVDVDPRAGEDFEEDRKRALKVLKDFEPYPTFIID
ncbi:MAG: hypothetical protein IIB64_06630, partial [Proteobacteria bacterium]|nr:hypothetical protein [Pseudomonadota bacterium]